MVADKFILDGAILAGGQAVRLGGVDKGLVSFRHKPLIAHVSSVMRPLIETLYISCNRNNDEYQPYADHLVHDQQMGYPGPLHGVLSILFKSEASHILLCPCDTPLITEKELGTLIKTAQQNPDAIVMAKTEDGPQPLHCIIPTNLEQNLSGWLAEGNARVRQWYKSNNLIEVEFPDEPFLNLNRFQDFPEGSTDEKL